MAQKQFKCNVCGYIHEGAAAPDKCPVCGVPASQFTELKPAKKGLFDRNGNLYIVVYATVMVVVVATLLAVAAMSLKERQNANVLNEKKEAILASLSASEQDYDTFVTAYAVDAGGERLADVSGAEALEMLFDLKGAFESGRYPVFEAADGRLVLPVSGSGLWGAIWGYVAVEQDMNTIAGVVFGHAGETPGLGAEIATPKHQAQYVGKTLFEGDEFVSVKLRKGGAVDPKHEVDAITGGTKTSDGVTAMLRNSLGAYRALLTAKRQPAEPAAEECETNQTEENNE